ncbi:uncharacterized protein LOC101774592 isoform X1 [Setaria italica]|uniref:uncharacterized protein LOC101774592 isoform X1 n=1 Tax=Setaria italica TaxID=4555 RepID=UPI0006475E5A|nr:uncharacterized protein LOC101774592 isoform X1 [Setaria italica]
MADRYRGYAAPYAHDRADPRGGYPEYFPSDGSIASYYASRPSVLPGGPDVLRNDVVLQPRAYALDGPGGVINPTLPGMNGLPAAARAHGPSPLEDPSFAGMSGLVPARALGPSLLEEPAVVGRSSSLGKGAGIPNVEHHSPLPNLDGPSEDESNILFVDGLPTDCTRREVAHLFRLFDGFKDIRVVHKEPRAVTRLMSCALWSLMMQKEHGLLWKNSEHTALTTGSPTPRFLRSNSQGSLSVCLPPTTIGNASSGADHCLLPPSSYQCRLCSRNLQMIRDQPVCTSNERFN